MPAIDKTEAEHFVIAGFLSIATCFIFGFIVSSSTLLTNLDFLIHDIILSMQGPQGLTLALTLSSLGSKWSVGAISVVVIGVLLGLSKKREALSWLLGISTAGVLSQVLKYYFLTQRPFPNIVALGDPAYPSGHTTALWCMITLAILIYILHHKHTHGRIALAILLVGLGMVVSVSRIYLGVHWFSDIIGGTFLGIGIALSAYGLGQLFERKAA